MSNNSDETDEKMANGCVTVWSIPLLGISSFGWCWLLTWITNFRDFRTLALGDLGGLTPIISGIIAIGPLLLLQHIHSDTHKDL